MLHPHLFHVAFPLVEVFFFILNNVALFHRNIIHGSDSVESAQKEISLWFIPAELIDYRSCAHDWVYE